MSTILITGASRGIGLELARLYSRRGDIVIATCRRPSSALEALDVNIFDRINVTEESALRALAAELGGERIDILIHNAGILSREELDDLDFDRIRAQFEVNTLGPLRVTRALINNLAPGSKVAILSSLLGSLADNESGGHYGYRISKAGVNMAGLNLAHDLRGRGIAVTLMHPGTVATRMTGGRGTPAAEAAAGIIARIDDLTLDTSGSFLDVAGKPLPW